MRRAVAIGLATGLLLGLAGRASDHLPPLIHWSASLGGPWLVAAFAAGALAAGRRTGAVAGGMALAFGTTVYYAVFHFVEHSAVWVYVATVGVGWALVGLAVGACFGWLGAVWREGQSIRRALAAGVVGGALIGEAQLGLGRRLGTGPLLLLARSGRGVSALGQARFRRGCGSRDAANAVNVQNSRL